ncbi:hypothetical protein ABI_10620 [Asticcacaulis biprosthecium C19]|uniref:Uncharacterized protein n=1 Tax=Asticcacaulis biprosthecium C19 TaxID=715226 RepID=F4QH88_9CAUL|nr:hypothetical protein ABI_10620 [Asticcacaulis biprosthecium C19]
MRKPQQQIPRCGPDIAENLVASYRAQSLRDRLNRARPNRHQLWLLAHICGNVGS